MTFLVFHIDIPYSSILTFHAFYLIHCTSLSLHTILFHPNISYSLLNIAYYTLLTFHALLLDIPYYSFLTFYTILFWHSVLKIPHSSWYYILLYFRTCHIILFILFLTFNTLLLLPLNAILFLFLDYFCQHSVRQHFSFVDISCNF